MECLEPLNNMKKLIPIAHVGNLIDTKIEGEQDMIPCSTLVMTENMDLHTQAIAAYMISLYLAFEHEVPESRQNEFEQQVFSHFCNGFKHRHENAVEPIRL